MTVRVLKAILLTSVAGAGLYAQSASRPAEWQSYAGDPRGTPVLAAHADHHEERVDSSSWRGSTASRSRTPGTGATVNAVGRSQAVPILVRGVLYTSTTRRTIVALDPATGKEIWTHELEKGGAPNRGVSYWPGDGQLPPRILAGTSDGRLLALDAATGKPVPSFGDQAAPSTSAPAWPRSSRGCRT